MAQKVSKPMYAVIFERGSVTESVLGETKDAVEAAGGIFVAIPHKPGSPPPKFQIVG